MAHLKSRIVTNAIVFQGEPRELVTSASIVMNTRLTCILFLSCLCVGFFQHRAESATITFQPAPLPGGQPGLSQWIEQGFRFSTPVGVASNDTNSAGYPFNGSAYLQLLNNGTPLTIRRVDAALFRATSIDIAEYSTVFTAPKTIVFTGNKADGSSVSTTFVTDGIIDGNGPLVDFETFSFPATFTNLSSLTTTTPTFSFDNVNLTVVPEPGALAFLAVGIGFRPTYRRRASRAHRR